MIFEFQDYRTFLRDEFLIRKKANPAFSLRGYARYLNMQPSVLSEILSGKRNLSEDAASEVCEKLKLDAEAAQYFLALVSLGRAKTVGARQAALRQVNRLRASPKPVTNLTVDAFVSMADWQHLAVLKALDRTGSATKTAPTIAEWLSLDRLEIESVLDRLERLELVEKMADGTYRRIGPYYLVKSPERNEGLRQYHTQMLQKTIQALKDFGPMERYTGTENLLLDEKDLPKAGAIIEECFKKLVQLSTERAGPHSEIYHVGIHAIPLSLKSKRRKK